MESGLSVQTGRNVILYPGVWMTGFQPCLYNLLLIPEPHFSHLQNGVVILLELLITSQNC